MPSYPVLQPDGQLAIWSTIVDHFTAFDCDIEGAVELLAGHYRDTRESLTQWCQNVIDGKREYDFMQDWPDRLGAALARFGPDDDTVKDAIERTPDPLMRRYAEQTQHIWRIERRLEDATEKLTDAHKDAAAEHADMERWREDCGNALRELAELRAALVVADAPIADWLSKFPQGARLEITIVFPGEYRIGYQYQRIHYLPGTPHYYQFGEAMARCYHRFSEQFPQEAQP